jgi:pimeloyl-ACP methyl ester carboxylesterase
MSSLSPEFHHVTCPENPQAGVPAHRMGVWRWGDQADTSGHVVVCAHGLTRQARDFDVLAGALRARSSSLTVLCPDIVGRGESDWLSDPMGYQIPIYVTDVLNWLSERHARQPITRLDWVGTSMGGVIGLILAAQASTVRPFPCSRLVLNDVGPSLPWAFVERLCTYVGQPLVFPSVEEGARALREISPGFGPHSDEAWLALNVPMFKPRPEGGVGLHYDPGIVVPIRHLSHDVFVQSEALLWSLYDQITCPTLLLRGVDSDVLTPQTARAMTERGPRARLLEFPRVGHAPTLVDPEQVQVVVDWLLA